jgi:hypothetical protein
MKKLVAAAGIGAALTIGSLSGAGTASASPLSYLQSLNNHGLTVYNTAEAVSSGYQICNRLNYTTGRGDRLGVLQHLLGGCAHQALRLVACGGFG